METCKLTKAHCEHCGSTEYEDVYLGEDGYTACCNELMVYPGECRGHHLED